MTSAFDTQANLPDYKKYLIKENQMVLWLEGDYNQWWVCDTIWQFWWRSFLLGWREIYRTLFHRVLPRRVCRFTLNVDFRRMTKEEPAKMRYLLAYTEGWMDDQVELYRKRKDEYRAVYRGHGLSDNEGNGENVSGNT